MVFAGAVLDNIHQNYEEIFSAEKKVADYILKDPEHAVAINVSELAELSGTSDATVIRLCKHLGYKGFYQMKLQLAHDLGRNQLISGNIQLKDPDGMEDVLKDIASNLIGAKANIDNDMLMKCVELICNCDTVHLVAAGNSIPASSDFAFRLCRIGIRANSANMPEQSFNNINLGTERDIVIGISHSGSSKHVLQAFELAKERKMKTIAITDLLRTPIAKEAGLSLSTGVEYSSVYIFGAASHIYIAALIDVLLCSIVATRRDAVKNGEADNVEFFLSETKI